MRRNIFKVIMGGLVAVLFGLAGCGSGGSDGTAVVPVQTPDEKLATAKKLEGKWSLTYTDSILGLKSTNLTFSNVQIVSDPTFDYEVTVTPSTQMNGLHASKEDVWLLPLSDSNSTFGFSAFEFKTDGNTILPGSCFYRTNKTTNVKSACAPLTGTKTSNL